jgi:hypothetical protein
MVKLLKVLNARANRYAESRCAIAYILISICLGCIVACGRSQSWGGPLATRADSAMSGAVRTCVKSAPPSAGFISQEDSILMCRGRRGRDVIIVWASKGGDVRALELYHHAPRSLLPALASRVLEAAKGPNARLMVGCPDYPTQGAWVWRDSTLYLDVEVEPESSFVRESVYRGESPLAYNCRLARTGR